MLGDVVIGQELSVYSSETGRFLLIATVEAIDLNGIRMSLIPRTFSNSSGVDEDGEYHLRLPTTFEKTAQAEQIAKNQREKPQNIKDLINNLIQCLDYVYRSHPNITGWGVADQRIKEARTFIKNEERKEKLERESR